MKSKFDVILLARWIAFWFYQLLASFCLVTGGMLLFKGLALDALIFFVGSGLLFAIAFACHPTEGA